MRHRLGLVMAAAGVDASNTEPGTFVLLPVDPDASARALRERLLELTGANVAVLVSDTFGRAWRTGQTDVAIGAAGLEVLDDHAGRGPTATATRSSVTAPAVADELAGAADLAQGKTTGVPGRGRPRARATWCCRRASTARARRPWSATSPATCSASAPARRCAAALARATAAASARRHRRRCCSTRFAAARPARSRSTRRAVSSSAPAAEPREAGAAAVRLEAARDAPTAGRPRRRRRPDAGTAVFHQVTP